jgi:predicted metal-dependent phosphotriesterase family hydrolase
MTHLLTDFLPRLRDRGVTNADIETMLRDNPRRLLTGEA